MIDTARLSAGSRACHAMSTWVNASPNRQLKHGGPVNLLWLLVRSRAVFSFAGQGGL
jgi:hypothetical protein